MLHTALASRSKFILIHHFSLRKARASFHVTSCPRPRVAGRLAPMLDAARWVLCPLRVIRTFLDATFRSAAMTDAPTPSGTVIVSRDDALTRGCTVGHYAPRSSSVTVASATRRAKIISFHHFALRKTRASSYIAT
eukprot:GEMP01047744.1.p1 GENE.GEMP01047744.1~~GEMP01047744.1.p1  ORF type:complete len:136 (-),score=29.26 GEMP01047744.1:525-932(-)